MGTSDAAKGKYRSSVLFLLVLAFLLPFDQGSVDADSRRQLPQRTAEEAQRERLACYRATARLGEVEGSIDFQMRCKPVDPPEKMWFGVSRSSLRSNDKAAIKAFRRYPSVLEADGVGRRFCSRDREEPPSKLLCEIKADHSVLVKGRIWVERSGRCDSSVVLPSSRKKKPCGPCALVYVDTTVVLFKGPPRGC
jgi:hypothetical protein